MEFETRLTELRFDAIGYIDEVLNQRGNDYQLIDPDEIEELSDVLYELPRGYKVSKHGFYNEYSLTSIDKVEGHLIFSGYSIDGENDEKFGVDDLSTDVLCILAKIVYNFEN